MEKGISMFRPQHMDVPSEVEGLDPGKTRRTLGVDMHGRTL
jgi:hypothetical protein